MSSSNGTKQQKAGRFTEPSIQFRFEFAAARASPTRPPQISHPNYRPKPPRGRSSRETLEGPGSGPDRPASSQLIGPGPGWMPHAMRTPRRVDSRSRGPEHGSWPVPPGCSSPRWIGYPPEAMTFPPINAIPGGSKFSGTRRACPDYSLAEAMSKNPTRRTVEQAAFACVPASGRGGALKHHCERVPWGRRTQSSTGEYGTTAVWLWATCCRRSR